MQDIRQKNQEMSLQAQRTNLISNVNEQLKWLSLLYRLIFASCMNDGNDETWNQSRLILKRKPQCLGHTSQKIRWIESEVMICAYICVLFLLLVEKYIFMYGGFAFISKTISSKYNCSGPPGFTSQSCRVGRLSNQWSNGYTYPKIIEVTFSSLEFESTCKNESVPSVWIWWLNWP